jgi:molybdate transport system substrate-binding protein
MDVPFRSNNTPLLVVLGAGLALLACSTLLWFSSRARGAGSSGGELHVHCAAGIRGPVMELAHEFEARTGTHVDISYGGSGTLLSSIQVGAAGDLFIAGDASFVERAQVTGAVRESIELSSMKPVLGVAAGNPHGIEGLAGLTRGDLRIGLGNPDAAAVGRVARAVLTEAGLWERVREVLKVEKPTVSELANDLALGALDVVVVWDATLAAYDTLEAVRVAELEARPRRVTAGVLAICTQPARALGFARFLASEDAGAPVFRAHGFDASGGDAFVEQPKLILMSGAMLRPALEATLIAFEAREGITIERVYNGCGMLVAQMQAGRLPDAYFSCDRSFLNTVQPHFDVAAELSANPIVILVQPENPHGIGSLLDLSRPGLRVGLGHPEKSALGALTRELLSSEACEALLLESGNLKVESPTGDLLVNQLRAGSLDAAVVYASNAALAGDEVQRIELHMEGALAVQPFAIGRGTQHRELLGRLLQELRTDESRVRFEGLDFQWLGTAQR